MAKMNQRQAKDLGEQLARVAYRDVTDMQLDAMDYEGRNAFIKTNMPEAPADMTPEHTALFIASCEATARNIFSTKAAQLRSKRHAWKVRIGGLTAEQASARIHELVKETGIRGVHCNGDTQWTPTVRMSRAGGEADATVYFRLDRNEDEIVNPDDETQKAGTYSLRAEISWSSTTRSIENALVSAKLYEDAALLASEVVADMGRTVRVMWTRGIK